MGNLFIENQTHYELFDTADGSPSICLSSELLRPEAMHHRQGALAESLYIYHGALTEALNLNCPPHILSVGLGCAYNEMISVAHFIAEDKFHSEFYLESFEADSHLRLGFLSWVNNEKSNSELCQALFQTFTRASELISLHFNLKPEQLKLQLSQLIENKQLVVRDWLKADTIFNKKFGIIYFDAFSGKSTPELWGETFLNQFLEKTTADNCGFATYAATGALNRALRAAGFTLADQAGFSGKRQSTRAFRSRPQKNPMLGCLP